MNRFGLKPKPRRKPFAACDCLSSKEDRRKALAMFQYDSQQIGREAFWTVFASVDRAELVLMELESLGLIRRDGPHFMAAVGETRLTRAKGAA